MDGRTACRQRTGIRVVYAGKIKRGIYLSAYRWFSRGDPASAADACEYARTQQPRFHQNGKGKRPRRETDATFAAESDADQCSIPALGHSADSVESIQSGTHLSEEVVSKP